MKRRPPLLSTCSAPGCSAEIPRSMLMCRPHWFQLPKPLRDAIKQTWADRNIPAWSANCLEARKWHAANSPAAAAARITGER